MRAAEDLIDDGLERRVDRIVRLFQDGLQNDEASAVAQDAQHLADDALRTAEVMEAERNESAVEASRGERQRVGGAGALRIAADRLFVAVTDVEHRGRFVDADDAAAF